MMEEVVLKKSCNKKDGKKFIIKVAIANLDFFVVESQVIAFCCSQ
ncbi:hypothetical protein [Enterococcus mundtii]|nr:hypothetical protein [Enterococcus mundtii]